MKKIFLSLLVLGIVSFASAQTTSNQGSKNTAQSSSTNRQNKNNSTRTDTINNRKVYLSKKTGQKATITGQQATGTNGSHASMPKNAVRKKE
jgi:hypothetical protein